MGTVPISEAEAIRDIAGLLARAQNGEEIIIHRQTAPDVVLRAAEPPRLRKLSESLRIARERASTVTLEDEFGRDLEEIVNSHPEPLQNPWD